MPLRSDLPNAGRARQPIEQLRDGFGLPRRNECGSDLAPWGEHKAAKMRAWMRESEQAIGASLPSEDDQIEIERASFVLDFLWLAAELLFESLQFSEKGFGRLARSRRETDDR